MVILLCGLILGMLVREISLQQACPKSGLWVECCPCPNFGWPMASFIMNGMLPVAIIVDIVDNTDRLTIICSSHHMWPSWQKLWTPLVYRPKLALRFVINSVNNFNEFDTLLLADYARRLRELKLLLLRER